MKPGIGLLPVGYSVSCGAFVWMWIGPPRVARRPRGWILAAHYGRGAAAGFVSRTDSIREGTRVGVGRARARCAGRRGAAPPWRAGAGRAGRRPPAARLPDPERPGPPRPRPG